MYSSNVVKIFGFQWFLPRDNCLKSLCELLSICVSVSYLSGISERTRVAVLNGIRITIVLAT